MRSLLARSARNVLGTAVLFGLLVNSPKAVGQG